MIRIDFIDEMIITNSHPTRAPGHYNTYPTWQAVKREGVKSK